MHRFKNQSVSYGLGRVASAIALLALLLGLVPPQAHASVTVLIGEPFGSFGGMMPVGHAGLYLDHVCADSVTHLRLCRPGETGIVLARYHRVANIDWLAIPVLPFLYGVDRPEDVPQFMTAQREAEIREQYRLRFLRDIIPDGPNGSPAPKDEWVETIGVAYDRRVWGYRIDTTPEQDQRLIEYLNDRPNVRAYKLRTANCAGFVANMVNLLYPGLVRHDKLADFGLMTPKQVARSVARYGEAHPEAHLTIWEVPQIPGTLVRSHRVRGVSEIGVKSPRYLLSLSILQPEVPIGCAIAYLGHGRWPIGKGATVVTAEAWVNHTAAPLQELAGPEKPTTTKPTLDTRETRDTKNTTPSVPSQ